jgi:hypothetical protein
MNWPFSPKGFKKIARGLPRSGYPGYEGLENRGKPQRGFGKETPHDATLFRAEGWGNKEKMENGDGSRSLGFILGVWFS